MRRREFITLIGGAAAWPITTYAQQRDGQPRIGVLMTVEDSKGQARMAAFRQGLLIAAGVTQHVRVDCGSSESLIIS